MPGTYFRLGRHMEAVETILLMLKQRQVFDRFTSSATVSLLQRNLWYQSRCCYILHTLSFQISRASSNKQRQHRNNHGVKLVRPPEKVAILSLGFHVLAREHVEVEKPSK